MTTRFITSVFYVAFGAAYAQDITATSAGGQNTSIASHAAMITFVTSNAGSVQEAAKSAAISGASGRALAAVAAHTLPIPLVGSFLTEQMVGRVLKFHHAEIKGFNVGFVQGLSSETLLEKGAYSFTIPAQQLQGTSPLILRLKPSGKNAARIVRSIHIKTKFKDNAINPSATTILGIDQEVVPSRQDVRGGSVVVTSDAALESGEYAIALVAAQADFVPVVTLWDFRIL